MKVKFTGSGGYPYEVPAAIQNGLKLGETYEVKYQIVDKYKTEYRLVGRSGEYYNSCLFDKVK